jgi:hypothetical protein
MKNTPSHFSLECSAQGWEQPIAVLSRATDQRGVTTLRCFPKRHLTALAGTPFPIFSRAGAKVHRTAATGTVRWTATHTEGVF